MAPKVAAKKKAEPKNEKPSKKEKGGKGKADLAAASDEAADAPGMSPDELEEQEEQAEAAASGSAGGNAAALAAAGSNEMSASFKNFRHHPDMENFYRFIYENDLRHEALAIIDQIVIEKQERRASKEPAAKAKH
jgi:hypothetical protein